MGSCSERRLDAAPGLTPLEIEQTGVHRVSRGGGGPHDGPDSNSQDTPRAMPSAALPITVDSEPHVVGAQRPRPSSARFIAPSAENNKKLQLTPRPLHEMLRPITEFYTHYRCTRGPPGCASLGDEVINYMAYSSAARLARRPRRARARAQGSPQAANPATVHN